MMIRGRHIHSDFCSVRGSFCNDTDYWVLMFADETIAGFTRLTWGGCGERSLVDGSILDGAERIALRSGEGHVS